jgi:hypothetical protein
MARRIEDVGTDRSQMCVLDGHDSARGRLGYKGRNLQDTLSFEFSGGTGTQVRNAGLPTLKNELDVFDLHGTLSPW